MDYKKYIKNNWFVLFSKIIIPIYLQAIQTEELYVIKAFEIFKPYLHVLIKIPGFWPKK